MPLLPGSIGETFVMLMAKCITSFSLGEALEMAWKVIFKPFFKFFQQFFFHKFGAPYVDLGLQAISEAFLAGKRPNYFRG